MDEQKKIALQQQFGAYLDMVDIADSSDQGVDLMSLFRELSGLKNEVRLESRQLKGALDDFRRAFTALDSGQQKLVARLQKNDEQPAKPIPSANTPQVEGLIDLYDRIQAGLQQAPPESGWFARALGIGRRYRQWANGHHRGQDMLLKRIEQLLKQENVIPMDVLHHPFDPHRMKAVGVLCEHAQDEGVVLEEQRTGFLVGDNVLRAAEVIVNKKGTSV